MDLVCKGGLLSSGTFDFKKNKTKQFSAKKNPSFPLPEKRLFRNAIAVLPGGLNSSASILLSALADWPNYIFQ